MRRIPKSLPLSTETDPIEAVGTAPYVDGDLLKAKSASLADAQRSAVEKAVGVRISGKIVVDKAVAVQSKISARTEGDVKRYEIVSEGMVGDFYQTRIRAVVSLRDPNFSADLDKEEEIQALMERGEGELKSEHILDALHIFFDAEKKAGPGDQGNQIRARIKQILASIHGRTSRQQIPFDDAGHPVFQFEISLGYRSGSKVIPLASFPLKTEFSESHGRLANAEKTNSSGIASFQISYVDPYKDRATLLIHPNWAELGASTHTGADLSWPVVYTKQLKLAVVVQLTGEGIAKSVPELTKKISSLFSGGIFDVQPIEDSQDPLMAAQEFVNEKGYLLKINIHAKTSKHPTLTLFQSQIRTVISFEHFPEAELIFEDKSIASNHLGATSALSLSESIDAIEPTLIDFLKRKMARYSSVN